MLPHLLLASLASLAPCRAATDCTEYMLNDCTPPKYREYFNAGSQELCQAHCFLFGWCSFYAYHFGGSEGIDCYLYDDDFSSYMDSCNVQGGPKRQGSDQAGSCFHPDTSSCEVSQKAICNLGRVDQETEGSDSPEFCETLCGVDGDCEYWTYNYKDQKCQTYASLPNFNEECEVFFGPKNHKPEDCSDNGGGDNNGGTTPPPCGDDCNQCSGSAKCPASGLAYFKDNCKCDGYFECFNGVMTSRTCDYCMLWDEGRAECDQPATVECGGRDELDNGHYPEDCPDYDPDTPAPCVFPVGYFPDPYDCDQYAYCTGGVPGYVGCSNTTFSGLYNPEEVYCDFDYRVECGSRPICRGAEHRQCQCQGVPVEEPRTCADTSGVTVLEDPYNCQHFHVCNGGALLTEVFCEEGLYLAHNDQSCKPGDGSVCGGRPVCGDIKASSQCTCS